MNVHLNLFTAYSQHSEDPIENNLSRGIAILMEENSLFFDRLIDRINEELTKDKEEMLVKPHKAEDRNIDIQQRASNLAGLSGSIRRIIPVTLVPKNSPGADMTWNVEDPITDISIFCGNDETSDLLIIEVKRVTVNADAQVRDQADKVKKGISDDVLIPQKVIHLEWEDIIRLLQDVELLQKDNFILHHYLEYLRIYHQAWFPTKPFHVGMGEEFLWKRVEPLAQNCIRLLAKEDDPQKSGEEDKVPLAEWTGWGYKVPLEPSWGYVREFHLYRYEDEVGNFGGIVIGLWPGNNKGQSRELFSGSKTQDIMSWTTEKSINVEGITPLSMSVKPFLKFAHIMGRHIMGAYLSPNVFSTDKGKIWTNFCERLNGTWKWAEDEKSNEWLKLKNCLEKEYPGLLADPEKFESDFGMIENSEKTFVAVSVGYEVEIYLPVVELERWDTSNPRFIDSADQDAVAKVIVSTVHNLKKKIEK